MVGYGGDGSGAVFHDEGGEEFAYGTGEGLRRRDERIIGRSADMLKSA